MNLVMFRLNQWKKKKKLWTPLNESNSVLIKLMETNFIIKIIKKKKKKKKIIKLITK